ncbi:MAG: NAD(P)H:quinone oxidoreductase [Candidatus Comchoanobacterales bacterium]
MSDSHYILILYYSGTGHVARMANEMAKGVEHQGLEARVRVVPKVSSTIEQVEPKVPSKGPMYATVEDLANCSGLLLGSPGYFGNMSSHLKFFLDGVSSVWLSGQLVNKPAGVFTSTASMHGGQESTLLSMMLPLFHLGMVMVGLPFTQAALTKTERGGTPYGASHVTGEKGQWVDLSDEERSLCFEQASRVADIAKRLNLQS